MRKKRLALALVCVLTLLATLAACPSVTLGYEPPSLTGKYQFHGGGSSITGSVQSLGPGSWAKISTDGGIGWVNLEQIAIIRPY